MGANASVRITRNFERTLDSIRDFLEEAKVPEVFEGLLDRLFDDVIPLLEEYPDIGVDFLKRQPGSAELRLRWDRLRARVSGEQTAFREYIADDHLILYAVQSGTVFLLAIKHHRQLSFDFGGIWRPAGRD